MPARTVRTGRTGRARRAPTKRGRRGTARRATPARKRMPSPRSTRPRSATRASTRYGAPTPELPVTVTGVLARLGRAVSAGDLPTVSLCFAYPSLLLTGADTHEFRDPLQVQAVFRESLQAHKERGIVGTHPVIESATDLGHGIYDLTVRWPAVDAGGRRVANERAHYIVQESAVGTALIRVGVAVQD